MDPEINGKPGLFCEQQSSFGVTHIQSTFPSGMSKILCSIRACARIDTIRQKFFVRVPDRIEHASRGDIAFCSQIHACATDPVHVYDVWLLCSYQLRRHTVWLYLEHRVGWLSSPRSDPFVCDIDHKNLRLPIRSISLVLECPRTSHQYVGTTTSFDGQLYI